MEESEDCCINHDFRNVGIVGHNGCGKTSLMEAILYVNKGIDKLGKIQNKNTVSDYDLEEKKRCVSISSSLAFLNVGDIKINIMDIPGYFDFLGEFIQSLCAIDAAIIVLSGVSGVKVGTERAFNYINKNNIPRLFFINKLEREGSDFERVLSELRDKFGGNLIPLYYPIGYEEDFKGLINLISQEAFLYEDASVVKIKIPDELKDKVNKLKTKIIEYIVETDDELLERYLYEGNLTNDEIYKGLINAVNRNQIVPVLCGSGFKSIGIDVLTNSIVKYFKPYYKYKKKEFYARVFKTMEDTFLGKLSIIKVIKGELKIEDTIYNLNVKKKEKICAMYNLQGNKKIYTKYARCGDIVAVAKLQFTKTGDTLSNNLYSKVNPSMIFPDGILYRAVVTNNKEDQNKLSFAFEKLAEEDLTFKVYKDPEIMQTIICGLGLLHLDVLKSKLKNRFNIDIRLEEPKINYRETIKGSAIVEGKYKKQSGGHGHYGHVFIKFEPRKDGGNALLFECNEDKICKSMPREYIPSIEKALNDCMSSGVLGGYPVIGVKATLIDGSYHEMDSSENAFKIASTIAFRKGMFQCKPVLLEPIMEVRIYAPEEYMGDIIADINRKEGRIIGIEINDYEQQINAEIPKSKMINYATNLKSMTHAKGRFTCEFKKYKEVIKR